MAGSMQEFRVVAEFVPGRFDPFWTELTCVHTLQISSMRAKSYFDFHEFSQFHILQDRGIESDRNSALCESILSELQTRAAVSGYLSSSCHWARRLA